MYLELIPGNDGCFICGKPDGRNSRSMGIEFFWDNEKEQVVATIEPDHTWCGYETVVHGGIISAVLDDSMEKAIQQVLQKAAFTATLSMKFRKNVTPGFTYYVYAFISENRGRRIKTKAILKDIEGTIYSEAEALFLLIP